MWLFVVTNELGLFSRTVKCRFDQALSCATRIAAQRGCPVRFFDLEDSEYVFTVERTNVKKEAQNEADSSPCRCIDSLDR